MSTICLEGRDVPASLRGSYTGNRFRVEVCESVTIPADAGLWSDGSRNSYHGVNMLTGQVQSFPGQSSAPWSGNRKQQEVKLEPGFAVVEKIMFQGKDLGLRIYLHPDNATRFLPVRSELTELEKTVLKATRSLKSSCGGKDRYEMTITDNSVTREQWDAARQTLITSGHLDKRGAITVEGKNAI